MNLGQLRTSLQTDGYGTDIAAAQTEAINAVYRRVTGLHQWPWLEKQGTTVATIGTGTYALTVFAADVLHVQAVRIEQGTDTPELRYMPPQQLRERDHEDRVNDVPMYWTRYKEEIRVWPRPSRAYTLDLDYVRTAPALVADVDTPLFDSTYHDVLTWGAAQLLAYRQRDWNAYNLAGQQFNQRLQELERAYGVRQRQGNSKVKRSSFWAAVGQP